MWKILSTIKLKHGRAGYKVKCKCGYIGTREKRNVDSKRTTCCKSCSAKNTAKKTFISNSFFIKNHKGIGELTRTRFLQIKHSAKRRNLKFEVTIEEIWNLFISQNKKCALSGVPLEFNKNASLDRIDSKDHYILYNLQWIHKDLNFMKQEYDQTYFISLCSLVHINQTK
jgi:hypothetical protein